MQGYIKIMYPRNNKQNDPFEKQLMSELFPTRRIQVLLPLPLSGVLDYLMPEEMMLEIGDFVTVPLSGREMQGVVWSLNAPENDIPIEKLKYVHDDLD